MNRNIFVAVAVIAAVLIGVLIGRSLDTTRGSTTGVTAPAEREILYWYAPMDPTFVFASARNGAMDGFLFRRRFPMCRSWRAVFVIETVGTVSNDQ